VSRGPSWIFIFRCGDVWDSCTEVFPTYGYKAIGIGQHDRVQQLFLAKANSIC
jgi:hypothetical protein